MEITFFEHRISRGLLLGDDGKFELDIGDAFMIMDSRRGGIDVHPEASSFLSHSVRGLLSLFLMESAFLFIKISFMLEKALVWESMSVVMFDEGLIVG